jgi:hypothetical protein
VISVDMGLDDRTNNLHDGRFLPGENCSAAKLWLAARSRIPLHGAPPLGNYNMASVGIGGFIYSRGWVELANPALWTQRVTRLLTVALTVSGKHATFNSTF